MVRESPDDYKVPVVIDNQRFICLIEPNGKQKQDKRHFYYKFFPAFFSEQIPGLWIVQGYYRNKKAYENDGSVPFLIRAEKWYAGDDVTAEQIQYSFPAVAEYFFDAQVKAQNKKYKNKRVR